jgi:hypothetical protein
MHAQGKKQFEASAPQEWELFEDIPLDMQPRPLLKVRRTLLAKACRISCSSARDTPCLCTKQNRRLSSASRHEAGG